MTDKVIKTLANIIATILIILVIVWFINLGLNAVVDGQKKVDVYQKYIYNME